MSQPLPDTDLAIDRATHPAHVAARPVMRLARSRGWRSIGLRELWDARELLWFLIGRDLAVRYKQTLLGAAWAVLQPLATMLVFSLVFGRLAGVPSDGAPYPVFSYAALLPWTFFANGVSLGASTLVNNPDLIRKIYFPRLVMPAAAVAAGLVDFTCAFAVFVAMLVAYGVAPTPRVVWLPAFLALATAATLGVAFWLAALNVRFRDVRYALPFLMQLWLFVTPVGYPSTLVPDRWRPLYALNPMVGVVDGFRWSLLGTGPAPGPTVLVSALVAAAVLVAGTVYFRRMERTFADIV
jgi:lipopolysaccharide transport system permease protein